MKEFKPKKENNYLKKSNVIVRALTNECAGIVTQRMFNFLIKTQQDQKWVDLNPKKPKIGFYLADFCKYYGIKKTNMFEKIKHKKQEMTVIKKEVDNLTSLKFYLEVTEENGLDDNFKFINLFLSGSYYNGYVEFEVNKNLINENFIDLKRDYTNVYLPYTKLVKSKYSLRMYEYLRSFLFFNHKTKKQAEWNHVWTFEQLAKILNLSLESSYFKYITILKKQILDPVKKDLAQTDILFDYELIKGRRKYEKIAIKTKLDKTKLKEEKLALTNSSNNPDYHSNFVNINDTNPFFFNQHEVDIGSNEIENEDLENDDDEIVWN